MLGGRSYRRGIGDVDEPEAVGEDVVPDAVLRLAQVAIIFEEGAADGWDCEMDVLVK
jgi:hypothetical protein